MVKQQNFYTDSKTILFVSLACFGLAASPHSQAEFSLLYWMGEQQLGTEAEKVGHDSLVTWQWNVWIQCLL